MRFFLEWSVRNFKMKACSGAGLPWGSKGHTSLPTISSLWFFLSLCRPQLHNTTKIKCFLSSKLPVLWHLCRSVVVMKAVFVYLFCLKGAHGGKHEIISYFLHYTSARSVLNTGFPLANILVFILASSHQYIAVNGIQTQKTRKGALDEGATHDQATLGLRYWCMCWPHPPPAHVQSMSARRRHCVSRIQI